MHCICRNSPLRIVLLGPAVVAGDCSLLVFRRITSFHLAGVIMIVELVDVQIGRGSSEHLAKPGGQHCTRAPLAEGMRT